MTKLINKNLDYTKPVKIAEGVYWVGFFDEEAGLHCNPYVIIDGEEVVVIDGGSRPDFPTVMRKILQIGIAPATIIALIYQHYDPDLVGSVHNFEEIIERDDLKIISDPANNMFIRHYFTTSTIVPLDSINHQFEFSSGRRLQFINTPYSHSAGSLITFDQQTGILFSSDLFGSLGVQWDLFLELEPECLDCQDLENCVIRRNDCPIPNIFNFHRKIMTSNMALRYSLKKIEKVPYTLIAPQHGSIIHKKEDAECITNLLLSLDDIGIDGIVKEDEA